MFIKQNIQKLPWRLLPRREPVTKLIWHIDGKFEWLSNSFLPLDRVDGKFLQCIKYAD